MKKYIILIILLLITSGWLHAQDIIMRIPDTTVTEGSNIDIPIYVDNTLTGRNVMSYMFQLSFDQNYIQPISVIVSGTRSAPLGTPVINMSTPGKITIAAAGTTALTGSGKFIYIRFKALHPDGSDLSFTGPANNYFNEGIPTLILNNGHVHITPLPTITVYPDNEIIARGEQLQFNVFDGTEPYQWFVTNPSISAVNSSGLLTAIQTGYTRVVAQDNSGIRDTTGQIEIRAMRLSVPDNLSQWQGSDIDVPVNVSDLSGLNIYSGSFTVNYNPNIISPVGVIQAGTLLASYTAPSFTYHSSGNASVAFAGVSPLSGSGTLIYLRFHVTGQNSGGTVIDFSGGLFNENLIPAYTNGYFSTIDLPVLTIIPNTGNIVAGETQQLTVNGTTVPPVTWSVSDTAVASVSSSGLLLAKNSGTVQVTIVDSLGATATSGDFRVYDTRAGISDTVICLPAASCYLPVNIGSIPSGESVFSFQARINYDTTYFSFSGIINTGTLTEGWTYSFSSVAGQIILAGSGVTPFNAAGTVVKLGFSLKPAFIENTYTNIGLHDLVLNEGLPLPLVDELADLSCASVPSPPVTGNIVQPTCTEMSGSVEISGLPSSYWTINPGNYSGYGSTTTLTGLIPGTYNFTVANASGCISLPSVDVVINAPIMPVAEAGNKSNYTGTPIQIGDLSSGPGTFSWLPATGLSNPNISQPLASPSVTTTYTLTVDNNGCVASDTVTVVYGILGYTISGKTRYLGKANVGIPVPNYPIYNPSIYDIDQVIVILRSYPAGVELARDTSDHYGNYQFSGVLNGTYKIWYDKYTADTMQWSNEINVTDVSMLKYNIGSDTLLDPSRNFSSKYKRAVNVDNNAFINVTDVSRIKAKIGSPYNAGRNFPKGNWVAFDTIVTVAGTDLSITLKTVCYGDYNASSTKYRDSLNTWSLVKALPDRNIISTSEESIMVSNNGYFEIPLRIDSKVNDFSALGLELNYDNKDYKLVHVSMPNSGNKNDPVEINPSLDEIIASNNDLLVTDENGVIRVVYATTNHRDVESNDEVIRFGFTSLKALSPGELGFAFNGTGVIGDMYGNEMDEAQLIMPKIFVQGNSNNAEFEFSGYPNPFNGNATLSYNLPEEGHVKISVYNSIGEQVHILVNEAQTGGKHTVEFEPGNLAQGMYSFKLEYSGAKASRIIMLTMVH